MRSRIDDVKAAVWNLTAFLLIVSGAAFIIYALLFGGPS